MSENLETTVKGMIKSCIVSRKGGVPLYEINKDYKDLVGENIPYGALGYKNLRDFITRIEYVKINRGDVLTISNDPKISHIIDLVKNQKNPPKQLRNAKSNKRNKRSRTAFKDRSVNNVYGRSSYSYRNVNKSTTVTTAYNRPENFQRNTKMEYNQSKWSNKRSPKNSWKLTNKVDRASWRYKNYNVARTTLQNDHNNTASTDQDYSLHSSKSVSLTSADENMYNFYSDDERRYAQENRCWNSWKFQVNGTNTKFFLEPLIKGRQLIGDDFFLELAVKNFNANPKKSREGGGLQCGLCISGQTIDKCRQKLENTEFLSGSVTVMLGAVDIFRGNSLENMVSDMEQLLYVLRSRFNISDITICTIPPLANYSVRSNLSKLSVLYSFNNWIMLHSNLTRDRYYKNRYRIIDLFSRFTDANYRTIYDYFQIDAKIVSGCSYPHVLWNSTGRRVVISMLEN